MEDPFKKEQDPPYPALESLRNILEWSEEGPGAHNFLLIIADSVATDIEMELAGHGYEIFTYNDLSKEDSRTNFGNQLSDAQTYMNFTEKKKIAILLKKQTWVDFKKDSTNMHEWLTHRRYLTSVEL